MNITLFKNFNLKDYEILNLDWSRKQNKKYSKLHSTSSYIGMFTPALCEFFINKFSKENDVIMDNFSGRGTTALIARETNRKFLGNDLNPYSFVLSKFKISNLKLNEIIFRINELEIEFNEKKNEIIINYEFKELLYIYDECVLKQLIFIRKRLGINWLKLNNIDNCILCITLSLMHGKPKKDGSTNYFSLSMPNTISMSPNYIKNYSKKIIWLSLN